MDTKLNVVSENGRNISIDVIDIFSNEGSDKEYILYSIGDAIYASILVEDENSFGLKTIEDPNEMKIVTARINELVSQ